MKTKNTFLNCAAATFIDLSLVFMMTAMAARGLSAWIYPRRWVYLLVIFLSYYLISYLWKRQTLGQKVMGVALANKNDKPLRWWQIVIREISKALLLIVVPAIFFLNETLYGMLGRRTFWLLVYIACLLIACFLVRIITKRSLWDCMVGTCKIKQPTLQPFMKRFGISLLLAGAVFVFGLMLYNNTSNPGLTKVCGFKFPFKGMDYPQNFKARECADYMSGIAQTPVEYLLSLFEKYDIVILEEVSHQHVKEWEMIVQLVSSKEFINKVGHVFTEYGNSVDQLAVDTVLQTVYDSDSSLIQAIRNSTHTRKNDLYFLRHVNLLNATLEDSLKIKVYPCDIFESRSFQVPKDVDITKRDSLMANCVIDWYGQTRKKCLVVTNYRHAFIASTEFLRKTGDLFRKNRFENQAQYIHDAYPDKVANVLYFRPRPALVNPLQFAMGKWETAWRLENYRPIGFDFKDTPLGKDEFDMYIFSKQQQQQAHYQDFFTGVIFDEYDVKGVDDTVVMDIVLGWWYYIDVWMAILLWFCSLIILLICMLAEKRKIKALNKKI